MENDREVCERVFKMETILYPREFNYKLTSSLFKTHKFCNTI